MDCTMPGLPVHHQLLVLTQTHVHRVNDAIQPPHPRSSPSSPTFNLAQHQGLFIRGWSESVLCNRCPNYWSFSFPGDSGGKASAYNVGDLGSIPVSGRSSGEGNDNCSTLAWKNPMDGGVYVFLLMVLLTCFCPFLTKFSSIISRSVLISLLSFSFSLTIVRSWI